MLPFRLYPEERHWWSRNDYQTTMDVTARLNAKRVLEFGPGSSTLSLIEGGATHIDTFEDKDEWFEVYRNRLEAKFPETVHLHRYTWTEPLDLDAPDDYELALIDGPHGTLQRPAVIAWCLAHARHVLVPTEEIVYGTAALRPHIEQLARMAGRPVEWMQTGPLSGGFALIGPRAEAPAPSAFLTFPAEGSPAVLHGAETVVEKASRRVRRRAAKNSTHPSRGSA